MLPRPYIGLRIGTWTVIGSRLVPAHGRVHGSTLWHVRCDCGQKRWRGLCSLRDGCRACRSKGIPISTLALPPAPSGPCRFCGELAPDGICPGPEWERVHRECFEAWDRADEAMDMGIDLEAA